MSLQAIHESLEEIPEQYRELYSERNGKFELTGVSGVKTQADVDRLSTALEKERGDHKATKQKFQVWQDMDYDEVVQKLDRIPELEAAAEGKVDEDKLNELADSRVKSRLAPVERENAKLKQQLEEASGQIEEFKAQERRRAIHDNVREALIEAKVLDSAQEDALMLAERMFEIREDDGAIVTKDGVGLTPGITAKDWLGEMQQKRPHWWPPSKGGGAGGSGGHVPGIGKNPWSKDHWNLTEQGRVVKEHGRDKAMQIAKQAGSELGAFTPPGS